jgi:hypothetical protein
MWPIYMSTLAMKTSTLDKLRPVLIKSNGVCAIAQKNFAIVMSTSHMQFPFGKNKNLNFLLSLASPFYHIYSFQKMNKQDSLAHFTFLSHIFIPENE